MTFVALKATDEGGIVLISFFLLMTVLLIGVGSFYAFAASDFFASVRQEYMTQAFYAAEAGIDKKIADLSTGNNAPSITGTVANNPYQTSYQVTCSPCTGAGDEFLVATGTVAEGNTNYTRTVRVTVQRAPLFTASAAVAISGVASTSGNITIDGRNHDTEGVLTGAPGLPGISTSSGTFTQGGSSKVGGNGIPPANPALPGSYQLNAPPLPSTPEAVLGISDGALDAYKTSSLPTDPFVNKIIYLTSSVTGVNLEGSSGILICHNAAADAYLKNIHGKFIGLIISDDLIHINGDAELIGAVVGLKTGGVTLGNGAGYVKYSSQTLSNLPLKRYSVTSWEDARNDSSPS